MIHSPNRVQARLAHLRRVFPTAPDVCHVDKDFDSVTAPEMVAERTFFLGEIFWVEREGWRGCGGFHTNPTRLHHPGLVVKKQSAPHRPVDMVPGTTMPKARLEDGRETHLFCPSEAPKWTVPEADHPELQVYVLDYWRPVPRRHVAGFLARLLYLDRQKLQEDMAERHGLAYGNAGVRQA